MLKADRPRALDINLGVRLIPWEVQILEGLAAISHRQLARPVDHMHRLEVLAIATERDVEASEVILGLLEELQELGRTHRESISSCHRQQRF